jgi:hypothetical protein
MKQNIGNADRIIRLIAAVVLIDLAASNFLSGVVSMVAWFVAIIFLLTAAVGFCPVYRIFGFRTISKRRK